jgi:GNAT superfamily N-acetyltransferase
MKRILDRLPGAPPSDDSLSRLSVHDATSDDVPEIASLRNTRALFERYLNAADGQFIRFLLGSIDSTIVAFGMIFFRHPPRSSPKSHLPIISDLHVGSEFRSRGIGSAMIGWMESLALRSGYDRLYMGVDPVENGRALSLYQRLGYDPVQAEPYRKTSTFHMEDGSVEEREYWRLDLVKKLSPVD